MRPQPAVQQLVFVLSRFQTRETSESVTICIAEDPGGSPPARQNTQMIWQDRAMPIPGLLSAERSLLSCTWLAIPDHVPPQGGNNHRRSEPKERSPATGRSIFYMDFSFFHLFQFSFFTPGIQSGNHKIGHGRHQHATERRNSHRHHDISTASC